MTDKTKKPRRSPVNSPTGVAAAIVAGGKKITPPKSITLTTRERSIFADITAELSKSEISDHKLTLIAMLAQQMAALESEQVLLRREGSVLTNSHGNAVANPRATVCKSLTGTVLSMRRSLGIHARELAGGDNRRTAIRRGHNMANETARDGYDDEGLIPFPSTLKDDDDDSIH